jgi:penicillin G amidase
MKIAGIIVFAVMIALAVTYVWLRRSLPDYGGEALVAGVDTPLEIVRDEHAVPHIFAADENAAAFGLGYAHAQDRLWQMEVNRRTAHGRLAEILGAESLASDEKMRTLGLTEVARHSLAHLDSATQAWLQAYANGVNAFLDSGAALPPEFFWYRFAPEPWQPLDSVVHLKMVAYGLGGNWSREATRAHLLGRLGPARTAEFLSPDRDPDAMARPDLGALYEELQTLYARLPLQQLAALQPIERDGLGSNNWVVGPERSITGQPLLADDPHVSLSVPGFWYLAHLSAGGRNLVGATMPGMPGVLVGRNDHLAWGVTDSKPDVQDLYIERLNADGSAYLTPEGWRRFTVRSEVIRVRDAADVTVHVQTTRHGPVVSNLAGRTQDVTPKRFVAALAWTALADDDVSIGAFRRINAARSAAEFRDGLRQLAVPQLSFVYADIGGEFGFIAPGRIPIRRPQNRVEGMLPVPGWDPVYDWLGYVPFESLPQSANPQQQAVWTANSRIVPPDYPYLMTHDWAYPQRAQRVAELLGAREMHSIESFKAIQADVVSLRTKEILPLMLAQVPKSSQHSEVIRALQTWDGSATLESPEQSIYAAWYGAFSRRLHADEFGDLVRQYPSSDPPFVANVLRDEGGQTRWCDDVRTNAVETCASLLEVALEQALVDLQQQLGADWRVWQWGKLHEARGSHLSLDDTPVLGQLLDIVIPAPGGEGTVNVGGYNERFQMAHGASLRMLVDLADPEEALFMCHTGQSGHFLSAHYADLTPLWRDVKYIRIPTRRDELAPASIGTIRLNPAHPRS